MAAAAVTWTPGRERVGNAESYGHRRDAQRLRLTAAEAAPIRYVLAEWSGEASFGSNMAAQLEKLAAAPHLVERLRRREEPKRKRASRGSKKARELLGIIMGTDGPEGVASLPEAPKSAPRLKPEAVPQWRQSWERDAQTMYVKSAQPSSVDTLWPQETWTDKSSANERFRKRGTREQENARGRSLTCARILDCWRALRSLAQSNSFSLVTLQAFYGDVPPGLCEEVFFVQAFGSDLGREYRRLIRLAEGDGWIGRDLETEIRARQDRNSGSAKLPADFAAACESLIVSASHDYRAVAREV